MSAMIIKLLTDRRVLGLIAAVALLLTITAQTVRLHHAKSDLTQARAALLDPSTGRTWRAEATTCARVEAAYADALQRQSESITRLRDAGDQATARASQAVSHASIAGNRERLAAQQVLLAKPNLNACADADALILRSLDLESRQ